MKELLIRSATGLVYGSLLIGSALLHPLAFMLVYLLITVLVTNEFIDLSRREGTRPLRIAAITIAGAAFLINFFRNYSELPATYFIILPAIFIFMYIIELYKNQNNPFLNLAMTMMAIIYIGLPMALFSELVYNPYSEGFSTQLLIFFFMILWIYDTGAYLTGKLIGKHKLFERISPKKTWEGLAGGITFAFLAAGFFGRYFNDIPLPDKWIMTGIIIIFGTFGDLVESLWKRSLGIKDSGKMLPGHGGWLDRLDSILLAVPTVYITVIILNAG